jgi:hypothetical protein
VSPAPGATRGARPSGRLGRFATGVGVSAGLIALDMLNRYQIAEAERPRIAAAIDGKVKSPEVQSRIAELKDQHRLDIARSQHAGRAMYATVRLRLSLTNDILNSVTWTGVEFTDKDESSYQQVVMSHDGLGIAEDSTAYVVVSLPIDAVEVERSEALTFDREELDRQIAQAGEGAPPALLDKRAALNEQIRKAQSEEEATREEEVRRATVIASEKRRREQQQRLREQLADAARRRAAEVQGPPTPPPQAQQPGPPSLLPIPSAAQDTPLNLLPGAQGPGPIELAAANVRRAQVWTQNLLAIAARLEQNRPSSNDPAGKQFAAEILTWQRAMKMFMNYYTQESRGEAVNALGELVARHGERLERLRAYFAD